jgi:hypothetical protein
VWATHAGLSAGEFTLMLMHQLPMFPANMPQDDVPMRLSAALLELLRDPPERHDSIMIGGAWAGLQHCITGRPAVAKNLYALGAFDTMSAHLSANGSGPEWIQWECACRTCFIPFVATEILRAHAGESTRHDKADFVSVGLFDRFVSAVVATAEAGAAVHEADTETMALLMALAGLTICVGEPNCDAALRRAGAALSFHINHSLIANADFGLSTGAYSAELCAKLFGRDEVDSASSFAFQQQHIDGLLTKYADMVNARGWWANFKPTRDTIHTLNLCVSDANKLLLLESPGFFAYLTSGLMLDPAHPRQTMSEDEKTWVQETHAECFVQVALFAPGCAALLNEGDAIAALEVVAENGMSEDAREFARGTLVALSNSTDDKAMDRSLRTDSGLSGHVMLSYNWGQQPTIQRVNQSLTNRGYQTWFDLIDMKGEKECPIAVYDCI